MQEDLKGGEEWGRDVPLRTTWEGKFFRPTWDIPVGQILVRETCLSLALNICPAVQNWLLLSVEDTVDVKQKDKRMKKTIGL